MEKNSSYYYKKLDEIYGLVYSAKLLIESTKRTNPEIGPSDIEYMKHYLNDGIENIINEDNENR